MFMSGCSPETTIALCLARSWDIAMACGVCTHRARWGRDQLAALPRDATLGDLATRLRCDRCGASEGLLSTLNGPALGSKWD